MTNKLISSMYPRVLIINYRPLNKDYATGITLLNLFGDWPKDRIGQIYADSISADNEICPYSWQLKFEDRRMPRLFGTVIRHYRDRSPQIKPIRNCAPNQALPKTTAVGNIGVRKRLISCVVRLINFLPYRISNELLSWILDFRPDVIYSVLEEPHITRLVRDLGIKLNIPIVPHIMDDWVHADFSDSGNNKILKRRLIRDTEWLIRYAPVRLAIGELMAEEYKNRHGLVFLPFMNCVDINSIENKRRKIDGRKEFRFVYTGGLHLGRWDMLLDIAEALSVMAISGMKAVIDIYTASIPDDMYKKDVSFNNIRFCGATPHDKINYLISGADGLLHVESFEECYMNYTRFSVSSKLPEYFSSGIAIFSYGPEDIASMKYISANNCGVVVGKRSKLLLMSKLRDFIDNDLLRSEMAERAITLCKTNHDAHSQREKFRRVLAASTINP